MEMMIDFPGGSRVDAHFGNFTVQTDQPPVCQCTNALLPPFSPPWAPAQGYMSWVSASSAVCLPKGIRILQRMHTNPVNGLVGKIDLEIQVPPTFPGEIPACPGEKR